ncbi:MAG: N-acetylmuramoyl-L-alanine amidase [Clostridium sp.]|uniref:peptidoglycan recognition protein family protein n=1 Tax=Clostridium sp. TaxID=1506 RepID=UPI002FCC1D50
MKIEKKLIKHNRKLNSNKPKFIIIHETDNPSAGADNHYKYWNGGERSSSCHFIVDDTKAIQLAEYSTATWHSGKKYGNAPVAEANNYNSIGIEICVNGDFLKARSNAIEIVKKIMKDLNIPSKNVIRHYDACLKYCPRTILDDPNMWTDFKNKLVNKDTGDDDMIPTIKLAACKYNPIAPQMTKYIKGLQACVKMEQTGVATQELCMKLPQFNGGESKGSATILQDILIEKGYLSNSKDRPALGPAVKGAIDRFRNDYGIPASAKVTDTNTWMKLLEF